MKPTDKPPKADAQPSIRPLGRPPLPADQRLIQRSIRLTGAQWQKIDANGGVDWLRTLIERGRNR